MIDKVTPTIIKLAIEEARKSDYNFQMGCVIFKNKKIISRGRNYPLRGCKKIKQKYLRWPHSIHAEIDTIIKAKTDLKGTSIFIVRINKKGEFRLAKPCDCCMKYINHVKISHVYYSIPTYPFVEHIKL